MQEPPRGYCCEILNYKMDYFYNELECMKFLAILDSVANFGMSIHFCLLDESRQEGDNRA